MPRVLDLNTAQSSLLELTLQDEKHTMLQLDIPTEALVRELEGLTPELEKIKTGDRSSVEMIYDLAARLISCNLDYVTVTGEELRTKYRMNLVSAINFFSAYFDAIQALIDEKN